MAEVRQVMLCGFGGQGIVLGGTLLGYAAFNDGKWVSGISSYGPAARGGECASEVVISDRPVTFPHTIEVDFLIAMYQAAYDKYVGKVKPGTGLVIYDEQFVSPKKNSPLKHIGIPATQTAEKELNSSMVANIVALAAAIEISKVVTRDAFASAMKEHVPERFRELNLKAANFGFHLGQARAE